MKDQGRTIVCGKCESSTVYHDYLPGTGEAGLACMTCGNRAGSAHGFKAKGEVMVVEVGKCENCERDGIKKAAGLPICYQCAKYAAGTGFHCGGASDQRKKALAEAKQLYGPLKPGEKLPRGSMEIFKKAISSAADSPSPRVADFLARLQATCTDPDSHPLLIAIRFSPEDRPIYEGLLKYSREMRRDPAQQILWMLQNEREIMHRRAHHTDVVLHDPC